MGVSVDEDKRSNTEGKAASITLSSATSEGGDVEEDRQEAKGVINEGSDSDANSNRQKVCISADNNLDLNIDTSGVGYSKYPFYKLEVDTTQDDKAVEVLLCNFSRPHMRAFHVAWMCFFVSFFAWFSIAPLLGEIRSTLDLSYENIWSSNISSMGGALLVRSLAGPQCDKWGARLLMGTVLIAVSVPTGLTGLVNSSTGLIITRFFVGFAGSAFVMCQYWTFRMFIKEVSGTATALVAGWGNLGGGATHLLMGSVLFPLFKISGLSAELAWRAVFIIPALMCVVMGIFCLRCSDDAPKGYFKEMKSNNAMTNVSLNESFRKASYNWNTWLLFIQYGATFGVELTMDNACSLYFIDKFEMSTEQAAAIASLFGWMNLFSRAVGGYCSDYANESYGMRGRLAIQISMLLAEGTMVFVFSQTKSLGWAIAALVVFSFFTEAAEGSTFGIVTYINPDVTGSVGGIVGTGGTVGAIIFGICFRQLHEYDRAFTIMGAMILTSSLCTFFVRIPGHAGLVVGKDSEEAVRSRNARRMRG